MIEIKREQYPSRDIWRVYYSDYHSKCFWDEQEAQTEYDKCMNAPKCKECGAPILSWLWDDADVMLELRLCFTCKFWYEKIPLADDSKVVRIHHTHYWIGEEANKGVFRGFGGQKFVIKFNDGRNEVTTTNLWCQGEIPERFWDRLPDNAEFVG